MKRVLLTGAGGFVGRHVSEELLARGFEVHAVSRHCCSDFDDRKSAQLTWHIADLLDPGSLGILLPEVSATHLIHLAWQTEPGVYWQSPLNYAWQNASMDLLKGFAANGGERAVLGGTCAEYDWTDGHCREDATPCRALSPYTESKIAFHDAANALAKSNGLLVAWARIFFPFGPFERPERLVPSVIRALLAGERASCSDGAQVRDFVYVRDVASALVALLASDFCGDVNIASGRPVVLKDLVTCIAQKLDARERLDFGLRPRRVGEPPRITADISRLKELVGWAPAYDMESAIDETIAWWRERAD